MNKCEDCGLPINACNALAVYREVADLLMSGRVDRAKERVESARMFEEAFNQERRG
jgi:hypothetical protein